MKLTPLHCISEHKLKFEIADWRETVKSMTSISIFIEQFKGCQVDSRLELFSSACVAKPEILSSNIWKQCVQNWSIYPLIFNHLELFYFILSNNKVKSNTVLSTSSYKSTWNNIPLIFIIQGSKIPNEKCQYFLSQ